MTESKVNRTFGELLVSILLASVAAFLAAIVGFVSGVFLGGLLPGEASESGLFFGPLGALCFGVAAVIVVFRFAIHYGDPPQR